ncbi:Rne/Rng family ribonuclease [Catellatospora sp. KI3]|uniref:Rne/Rng family ribonuclease n=1 Tax=Catellatospora sp. KI3 TaxID=3041620 RepID=UPI0024831158|nr:Rne/Rng family ribonuclease [Catellatospora sp. KI3]MDI1465632.1 Rne/Rng family ribonuclease [Catellatospora sp. KI3]
MTSTDASSTPDAPTSEDAAQPEQAPAEATVRRRTRKRTAAAEEPDADAESAAPVKKATRRRKKAAEADISGESVSEETEAPVAAAAPVLSVPGAVAAAEQDAAELAEQAEAEEELAAAPAEEPAPRRPAISVLFMAPEAARAEQARTEQARAEQPRAEQPRTAEADARAEEEAEPAESGRRRRRSRRGRGEEAEPVAVAEAEEEAAAELDEDDEDGENGRARRRRGRRGRGRGKGTSDELADEEAGEPVEAEAEADDEEEPLTRRRRRRRRKGAGDEDGGAEDGVHTVVRIREPRAVSDEVQGVSGSTRLEAKRQRRRDGREQRRTRPPILTESEFLARREAVDRVMVIRENPDRTQIAVMEDGVLVEHYVTRASAATMVGNVYLGKVQNVLPSMEAAFVDLGRGRNAVLYAGEVNWDAAGLEGRSRSIEQALRSGDSVLVQVTKDPLGHKGARLTSHVALSGRHLVFVPNGNASGISRKLSDVERKRLRDILKKLVPEGAGVIVRTAAEGASEEDLARDVKRLQGQWEDIQARAAEGGAPALLYGEPDLVVRVVRDLFNEDFKELVVQGDNAYETVQSYLHHVSPDLVDRVHRHTGVSDVFATYRIDEQILKGLDRKVFLPSGGHLVIDRTEAMTVVDVNTGKYTGAGGNLEETVTRNNLEAAEEIVRQLRLRDLGGIVVIDFIDMVLESNRELVLRRLTECLGRDRTKHQVTEITSLGLVQMTRKRIGAGLLEAFSEPCEHCKGRGVIIHTEPVSDRRAAAPAPVQQPAPVQVKSAPAQPAPKSTPEDPGYYDTAGYDLSRYENADDDGDGTDEGDADDAADVPTRRRTRRGGRRRTRP